ncbi:MAG: hypothetical protein K0R92_1418 [Lachnospiraceae bacterium]|jgi:hypothetical protein|nr:hypothetical protein [Lachnospiraceae bacterium]
MGVNMTEEINNLNTDLKELFVNSGFDKMNEILNEIPEAVVLEITLYNYEIIKKYYENAKFDILFQFIKFVAYSSYLCDYSAKCQLIANTDYESMNQMFTNIYLSIKSMQK